MAVQIDATAPVWARVMADDVNRALADAQRKINEQAKTIADLQARVTKLEKV